MSGPAPFDASVRIYDLLYRDKDAAAEAQYVASHLRAHHPDPRTLLDVGCGTGRHAGHLRALGFDVTGVEVNEQMAARAREVEGLEVVTGDARTVRLGHRFDAVVALFHVVSYQATVADLLATFTTAATHLHPGGLFVFDAWSTPAVLHLRPESRFLEVSDEQFDVARTAVPTEDVRRSLVDVNYHVRMTDRSSGAVEEFREVHTMRHLTEGEVELLARATGFEVLVAEEFVTGRTPSSETWGVCFVLRALRA